MGTKPRRWRYSLAMSLDGFISGPNGEYDWIIMDPSFDFAAAFQDFDTLLMGRRTYEIARNGMGVTMPGMQTVVCSRTLQRHEHPGVTIVSDAIQAVGSLKAASGKDIWLFGGGALFRDLLDAGLVDTIEVSIVPILLTQGIPLLPAGMRSRPLKLTDSKTYPSGVVALSYAVNPG